MKTPRARKASKARRKAAVRLLAAGMALRRGRETLSRAYGWAHDQGNARFGALRLPRRTDISHLTEANPLLLGAVGLGLGVAIGTLFPRGMSRRRPMATARTASTGNSEAAPVKSARRRKKSRTARARAVQAAAS